MDIQSLSGSYYFTVQIKEILSRLTYYTPVALHEGTFGRVIYNIKVQNIKVLTF